MCQSKPITPQPALVAVLFALMVVSAATVWFNIRDIRPTIEEAISSDFVSQTVLSVFRLSAAAFCLGLNLLLLLEAEGLTFPAGYLPQSKMHSLGAAKKITLIGWSRLSPFTVQSWGLLGVYFLISGVASIAFSGDTAHAAQDPIAPQLAFLLFGLFNLLYPVCLLVSVVTTYVLIPSAPRGSVGRNILKRPRTLIMHNANIVLCSIELLFNRQRIMWQLAGLPVLWGMYFVIFTWTWSLRRARFVHYNFIDPTLPPKMCIAFHLALVTALFLFSVLGSFISSRLDDSVSFAVKVGAHGLVIFSSVSLRFAWRAEEP
mmetsp:Transcript_21036/g.46136  ORF Transcript_21036/g.46136 Transcript_21036/m.46136 type:complete len:317 (-) Transcript_21036:106-1056(-)